MKQKPAAPKLPTLLGLQPITSRSPASTSPSRSPVRCPILSISTPLSTVSTCETLTTDSFRSPDSRAATRTFPGATARRRFEVIIVTMTVEIRLSLNVSVELTTTG